MKLVILLVLWLLRISVLNSIDLLDCALGHVQDHLCPKDGGWSQWSAWGQCEGECGTVGRQLRFRNCSNPRPQRNGADCDGDQLDVKPCNVPGCSYEQYEKLLAQDSIRLEALENLKTSSGPQKALLTKCLSSNCDWSDVSEALFKERTKFWNNLICVKKNTGCPVAGGWGDWTPWTRCSARCGVGQQMRCRACCDPPPSSPDVDCHGDPCEYQPCTGVSCGHPLSRVGDWSEWSDWSACSSDCDFGYTRRTRSCKSESETSSNEERSAFIPANEYGTEDYLNADEYYYYPDNYYGIDRKAVDYEDSHYDGINRIKENKRGKRSVCGKPEYDTSDEEDLPSSLSKSKRTTRKTDGKIIPMGDKTIKTTVLGQEQDSWIFSTTEDQTTPTKLESETELSIISSTPLCQSSIQAVIKMSRTTTNKIINAKSDNINEEQSTENFIPKSKPLKKPKIKNNRITVVLHEQDEDDCGELYKDSSTAAPCKGSKTVFVTDSLEPNQKYFKKTSPKVSSSTLIEKAVNLYFTTKTPVLCVEDTTVPASTLSSTSTESNVVTTIKTSSGNLETSLSTDTETDLVEVSSSSSGSTEVQSSFSASTENPTTILASTSSFSSPSSLEALKSTTSTQNLFPISHRKTSTSAETVEEHPSFTTTSPLPDVSDVTVVSNVPVELNISRSRPVTCDLSKKFDLPRLDDSFFSGGCNGPFEEVKPCNTQPCNENGGWSDWSSWSPCAPDCGLGWQSSVRACTNPEPRGNGSLCVGEVTRRHSCYNQPCPVAMRTAKAVFMTGDSVVRYAALQHHSSTLLLYLRFRHFSPTGSIVVRRAHDCFNDKKCDHVTISLYLSHVLVSVLQQQCHADFLTSQRLSVGEWHEILFTIAGAAVTMRLDDSVLTQTYNLSCNPSSPNYDTDMKLGGSSFVGEVDRLIVNFKNYIFHKKREKRDSWAMSDDLIAPTESLQVQQEVNTKDVPLVSLAHYLRAPCFTNQTSWHIELALKPHFPDGLVLFMKGYDSRDFLFVSLEQSRVRMRIRAAAQAGECEHSETVFPHTWVHLELSRPPEGPVGLSVNGGPRCVVSLAAPTNNSEEPVIYCLGGILLGDIPIRVKTVLSETGHSEPTHSPLGLLGHMSVDNHSLDLTQLPHKIAPDLTTKHPDHQYRLSSYTAATTVYYEEMVVLQGERMSMPCIFDLSPEKSSTNNIQDLDLNWYKLDVPVQIMFSNESGVHYETITTGKSITLNITSYTYKEMVEGFYSCWLYYPLPLQSGLTIVTYGVIIINTDQDKRTWLFWLMTAHLCIVVVLLILLVLWHFYEAYQDYKKGSGYYRCKKLKKRQAYDSAVKFIFSDKNINRLGGMEPAEQAFERHINFEQDQSQIEQTEGETTTDTEFSTDNDDSQPPPSLKEAELKGQLKEETEEKKKSIGKNIGNHEITVGVAGIEFMSPFSQAESYTASRNESIITMEELMQSDFEEANERMNTNKNDNLIDVSERWTHKEPTGQKTAAGTGQIKNTSAYRRIESELKFKPEKFRNLRKYGSSKQNKSAK